MCVWWKYIIGEIIANESNLTKEAKGGQSQNFRPISQITTMNLRLTQVWSSVILFAAINSKFKSHSWFLAEIWEGEERGQGERRKREREGEKKEET